MSGDGFTTQPADLQTTAPQYGSVADLVQGIYSKLLAALDAEGTCWGNDAQGQAFGIKYCPPAISVLEQFGNTNMGVQSMVDSICTWAKNYLDTSQGELNSANQLANGSGS
jgi:hypothetical protein